MFANAKKKFFRNSKKFMAFQVSDSMNRNERRCFPHNSFKCCGFIKHELMNNLRC